MRFLKRLFGKGESEDAQSHSAQEPTDTQSEMSADDRARALFETYKELGVSDEDHETGVSITSEILDILDLDTTELYPAVIYWQRAMRYKLSSNYDAALEDLAQARVFAQRRSDRKIDLDCIKEIEQISQQKRRTEIEARGGERGAKLQAMEKQAEALRWDSGPATDTAFNEIFGDLVNSDSDIRLNATRILSDSGETLKRLVSIYEQCLVSDPPRAHLAGRVLGRRIAKGVAEPISSRVPKLILGLDISVLPCPCAHCHAMNIGIAAPAWGLQAPYYHQKDDKGAHAIPVMCDKCSETFFVVWDAGPA